MFADEARDLILSLPASTEEYPFGPDVLVYKVAGKMFATLSPDSIPVPMNLKCDPDRALDLRAEFAPSILPGYHMNKRLWNTLVLDGSLPAPLVADLIRHSYELVVANLPKSVRSSLPQQQSPPH